jgi:hypothetical protein
MDSPEDLRIQAAGWRMLAGFYGSGSEALLETARFLEAHAAELERRAQLEVEDQQDRRKRA